MSDDSKSVRIRPKPGLVKVFAGLVLLVAGGVRLRRARGRTGPSRRGRCWAFMGRVDAPDVNDPAKTFMVRVRLVQTPLFGVYLHRLNGPDQRSTLHDHPWSFVSFVLRGGYTEELGLTSHSGGTVTASRRSGRVLDRVTRTWRAGSIHRMRADDPHRITELHRSPTWTLVFAGPRHFEPAWGYWDETGWIPWHEHPHSVEFEAALKARAEGEQP